MFQDDTKAARYGQSDQYLLIKQKVAIDTAHQELAYSRKLTADNFDIMSLHKSIDSSFQAVNRTTKCFVNHFLKSDKQVLPVFQKMCIRWNAQET